MKLGLRTKLFLISLSLLLVFGGVGAVALEGELIGWVTRRVQGELVRHARTVREAVVSAPDLSSMDAADQLCDRLGRAMESRVTLLDARGKVLGDSELSPAQLVGLDSHGDRQEFLDARARGLGASRRESATMRTEMLYVALPFERGATSGVVRVAMPLGMVEDAQSTLRVYLATGALVGLVTALAMSWLAASLFARTLGRLVEHAREMVAGEEGELPESSDEERRLAGSLNAMAEELERTLAVLAEERGRSEAVLESMIEGVLALDEAQRVTLVNAAASELLELGDESLERPLGEVLPEAVISELVAEAREGPATRELAIGDPPRRRILARATPLGSARGTVVVLHDITEMRRLETVRKDFVANVSHELRTPVSIIRANAETLLDGAIEDPVRGRGFVEAVLRNSERLTRLISDLLDLSRIEAGRYKLELRPVEILEAVGHAVEAVEAKAAARRLELDVDVPEALDVRADPKALDQVLINLLDNAVKYTPEGGSVRVRAEPRGAELFISVEDDGPGIPAEHRARIFERFYRVDPGRSRDMGGTGLGLAIVKHLVESMRGKVGVEPARVRGTVFWMTLPLAGPAEAAP